MKSLPLPSVLVACVATSLLTALLVSPRAPKDAQVQTALLWGPFATEAQAAMASASAGGYIPLSEGCVGMFCAPAGTNGRKTMPATNTQLTVIGSVPCQEEVGGWALQGIYRVFRDGSVQALATPIPPCPSGDFYVWVAYPR